MAELRSHPLTPTSHSRSRHRASGHRTHHHHHHTHRSSGTGAEGGHSGGDVGRVQDDVAADVCWICMLGEGGASGCEPLVRPCACPRLAHEACLARWCLQSAGKREETECRFCHARLPEWKKKITRTRTSRAVPTMSITWNHHTYWLKVFPGEEGRKRFQDDVRRLLLLRRSQEFDVAFDCQVPGSVNSKLELQGLNTFDAAVYCASITAAQRHKSSNTQHSRRSAGAEFSTRPQNGTMAYVENRLLEGERQSSDRSQERKQKKLGSRSSDPNAQVSQSRKLFSWPDSIRITGLKARVMQPFSCIVGGGLTPARH